MRTMRKKLNREQTRPPVLDDEINEQEDISFYRRLNVELDQGIRQEQRKRRQEIAEGEELLFGEAQTSEKKNRYYSVKRKTELLYTRTACPPL